MKTKFLLIFWVISKICCSQNTWTQKAIFPGLVRLAPSGFTIGTKAYLGTGYYNSKDSVLKDFWEWNQVTNIWTRKADFAGLSRGWATGFSIGSKGYIGTGSDQFSTVFTDFWEYDTATNVWTKKADFAGAPASQTASFSIGSKGYVLGGNKDFWEYNPTNDNWTKKASFPGCDIPIGFSIGNFGYLGTGLKTSTQYCNDFWQYDPIKDEWSQLTNFPGVARIGAVGFSSASMGYIGTGADVNNTKLKDFWQFEPITNSWIKRANFGGSARLVSIGLAIGSKGYIGTGYDFSGNKNDFWEYGAIGNGIHSINLSNSMVIKPNPFNSETTIKFKYELNNAKFTLINSLGQIVKIIETISSNEIILYKENLTEGIYYFRIEEEGKLLVSDKVSITN